MAAPGAHCLGLSQLEALVIAARPRLGWPEHANTFRTPDGSTIDREGAPINRWIGNRSSLLWLAPASRPRGATARAFFRFYRAAWLQLFASG